MTTAAPAIGVGGKRLAAVIAGTVLIRMTRRAVGHIGRRQECDLCVVLLMAARALTHETKPVVRRRIRGRCVIVVQRWAPHRCVVAHIAFQAGIDEMTGSLALGVNAVVAAAARSDHLGVIHFQRRAELAGRTVGMAGTALGRGVRMRNRQRVASGARAGARYRGRDFLVVDDDHCFPNRWRRVMARVAVVAGGHVAHVLTAGNRAVVARRTGANHFKVINL